MRIAVFGDIHGNLRGLQAALADLRTQSPDALVVSGDLVYKMPWGAEVVDLLAGLPCQCVLGNAELYLTLWGTELWPGCWEEPHSVGLVQWERERLGAERLRWLAQLPEHVGFSAGRLDDLLIVHGAPGNPFLPLLARPGEDASPFVQTDQRAQQLLGNVDADVVVCGHTHAVLQRPVPRKGSGETLVVCAGSLSYRRGKGKRPGLADYALLDWGRRSGWQVTVRSVEYDAEALWRDLLAWQGRYPTIELIANQLRPPGAPLLPEPVKPNFGRYRWGFTPEWWARRDELPAWRRLRGEDE